MHPQARPRLVVAASIAIVAIAVAVAAATSSAGDWRPLSLLAVLIAIEVASSCAVTREGGGREAPWATGSSVPEAMAMILLGPAPALAIGFVGLIADHRRARVPLIDQIANFACYSTFIVPGALVAGAITSGFSLSPTDPGFVALALVVSLFVDFESAAFCVVVNPLTYPEGGREQWRRMGERVAVGSALNAGFTAAAVYVYGSAGLAAVVPMTLVLLAQQYMGQSLSVSRRRAAKLEAQRHSLAELSASRGRLVGEVLRAEENERRRLAEALHDHALQDLLLARQALASAEGPDAVLPGSAIDRAIAQLRGEITDLHPAALRISGLGPAIKQVAERQAERGAFEVSVDVDRDSGAEHEDLLFVLARELLVNAAKHSGAAQVWVTIQSQDEAVTLEVRDDGSGIPSGRLADALGEGRIGLASIVERVEAVGGKVEIARSPDGGALVRVRLVDDAAPHSFGYRRGAVGDPELLVGSPDVGLHGGLA